MANQITFNPFTRRLDYITGDSSPLEIDAKTTSSLPVKLPFALSENADPTILLYSSGELVWTIISEHANGDILKFLDADDNVLISVDQSGIVTLSSNLIVNGTIRSTALTAGRIPFAGTGGVLGDDADLSFASDTLTATKLSAPTHVSTPLVTTANDLTVTCGTDKTLVLGETVWKDVFFPMGTPKATGAGNPSLVNWIGNLSNFSFSINDVHNFDPQEFPHDGKQGVATGSIHIHWVSRTSVAATRGVKWEVEYSQTNVDGVFPSPTTISVDVIIPANTAANTHFLTPIGTMTTGNIGSHMVMRLKRIASADTAPAADPVVLGVHYHYEVDTVGSRQISTK